MSLLSGSRVRSAFRSLDARIGQDPSLRAGFPAAWSSRSDLPLESGAKFAAAVHVYHLELLDELIDHLGSIPVEFDLIVTNASGVDLSLDPGRMPHLQQAVVLGVQNRGRDLWPLAQVVNAGLLDRYNLILKVHTKRSDWRAAHGGLSGTGSSWRSELLSALLGDGGNVGRILDAFATLPALGMVTADGSLLGPGFWGSNERATSRLMGRIGLEIRPEELRFAAGSMYWTRASILQRLRALHLEGADFEDERGQIDGTTAHALERLIGLVAQEAGLRIAERSQLGVEV